MIYNHFLKQNTGKINFKTWIYRIIIQLLDRLYTNDKTTAIGSTILNGTGIYKDILENNVDFDKSFNSDLMFNNTLTDHNSALLVGEEFIQNCKVYQLHSIFGLVHSI